MSVSYNRASFIRVSAKGTPLRKFHADGGDARGQGSLSVDTEDVPAAAARSQVSSLKDRPVSTHIYTRTRKRQAAGVANAIHAAPRRWDSSAR